MTWVSQEQLISAVRDQGALVSFPTDTVPALASHPAAATGIFLLKQRPTHKPLVLMAAQAEDLWPYVQGSPEQCRVWARVAQVCWPGAFTLVLPASPRRSPAMNPQGIATIGLRVPDHPQAQAVLAQTGPLATTSVNLSQQPPLLTPAAIEAQFPQLLVLEPEWLGGSGQPSTVVQWTGEGWQVLRAGNQALPEFLTNLTEVDPPASLGK